MGDSHDDIPNRIGGYEILEKLGQGAAGDVFKALSTHGDGVVAVKRLKPGLREKPKALERFRREFEAMRLLDHPAIVKAFDAGKDGEDVYLVMEYVSTEDVSDILQSMDEGDRLAAAFQVAAALTYAHNSDIVHRDLKASNILVAQRRPLRIKLADFGIARLLHEDYTTLTDSGAVIGTLNYLAPEQLLGERADHRCDIYALGILAFILWSHQLPFSGPLVQQIRSRVMQVAPRLRSVCQWANEDLDELIAAMMERDPNDRPQSTASVARQFLGMLKLIDPERAAALKVLLP